MFTISKGKNGDSYFKSLLVLSVLIISMVFITPGCSEEDTPTDTGTQDKNEVSIESNSFSPQYKTIAVGTTLKWINNDGNNHKVVSGPRGASDGIFSSGTLGPGDDFSYKFDRTGTFEYFCSIHPSVTGTITVN